MTPEVQSALEELKGMASADEAAAPEDNTPVAIAEQPVDYARLFNDQHQEENPGFFKEAYRSVVGGVFDASHETVQAVNEFDDWVNRSPVGQFFGVTKEEADEQRDVRKEFERQIDLGKRELVGDNQSVAGQMGRSVSQFATAFIGLSKATSGIKVASKLAVGGKAAAQGAVVDAVAFDPHEKRLANLVTEWMGDDPYFGKEIADFLKAEDTDTAAEGRLKNAVEGLGLGLVAEGVFYGLRKFKWSMRSKGSKDPLKTLDDATEEVKANGGVSDVLDDEGPSIVKDIEEARKAPRTPDAPGGGQIGGSEPTITKSPTKAPRTPDETEYVPPSPKEVEEAHTAAVKEVAGDNYKKLWIDSKGDFEFSETRPEGSWLDYDKQVVTVLKKEAGSLTEADLKILRAYRGLQKAAQGKKGVAKKSSKTTKPAESSKAADNERAEQELYDATTDADELMSKGVAKDQGGFASPTVLAHMASGGIGATAGFATAPEGSSLEEKLTRALMGAGVGMGITAGGRKMVDVVNGKDARLARSVKMAKELDTPHTEGIQPVSVKRPVVPKRVIVKNEQVDEMYKAFTEGRVEDLSKSLDESDFNMARIDSDADIDTALRAFSKVFAGAIDKSKKGVQSFGDIKKLAKQLGATPESLAHLSGDTENLAPKILAARTFLNASAGKVSSMAREITADPGNMAKIIAFRKQIAIHAAVQARLKGVQTEVGRALAQFRITSMKVDMARLEQEQLLNALGGAEKNKMLAEKLSLISDPNITNAFARKMAEKGVMARTADALFEVWVNGILSGISTHVVNAVGNASVAALSVPERALGALIGSMRGSKDGVKHMESLLMMRGMADGFKDAIKINSAGRGELLEASKLFASGRIREAEEMITGSRNLGTGYKAFAANEQMLDSPVAASVEALGEANAVSSAAFGLQGDKLLGKAVDYLGAAIRTPGGRLLATADEIGKVSLYRGELRAQAYRIAADEGLDGDAFARRAADLLESPTTDMADSALAAARRGTFTTPLGETGKKWTAAIHSTPFGRWIAPFIRTPINILKYVGERTPLGIASGKIREDLAAGGARADMALSRMALGSMFLTMGWQLKSSGLITGGGDKKQAAERLAGRQQYSLKVGDEYYSFNRADPLGMFLGLSADLHDILGQAETADADEVALAAVTALQRNLISRSYVKNMTDIILVSSNPEMYGEKFVQKFFGSWVPNWLAQVNKVTDDEIKDVWTIVDAVKARIPGMSKEVKPHVDLLGRDVHFSGGLGPDIASPVRVSKEDPNPLAQEIADLNADLSYPPRRIAVSGTPGIDLTPDQYYKFMKEAGRIFRTEGEKLVGSKEYQRLPEAHPELDSKWHQTRELQLKRLWTQAKTAARNKLLTTDKDLLEEYQTLQKAKGDILNGDFN